MHLPLVLLKIQVLHRRLAMIEEARAVVQPVVSRLRRRLGGGCQQISDLLDAFGEVELRLLTQGISVRF